jgi:hypothetical protein
MHVNEINTLTREQLVARVLGMRQGAAVALSRRSLFEMSDNRLRMLLAIANLVRAKQTSRSATRIVIGYDQPPWSP